MVVGDKEELGMWALDRGTERERGAGDEDERRCWMTFRRVSRQERVSDGSWGGRGVKAAAKQRAGQRGVPRGSRRAGKAASTLRR